MSPEQKVLVKQTWQKVTPTANSAARMFYDRLFEIDATTRPLFEASNLAEQRRKLIQALTVVVQGLDHLEALVPTLTNLGRRHAQYGVTDGHYDAPGRKAGIVGLTFNDLRGTAVTRLALAGATEPEIAAITGRN